MVGLNHFLKNSPDTVFIAGNEHLHAVPVDIAQGVDDVGQAVIAVGILGHQAPGVVQGALHRAAAQLQVVVVVGEGQVPTALHANPVVEGAQYEI